MFVEERKQRILNILKQKEKVSVNELSSLFSVSKVIIRKDLCNMEEEDLLTRTHGGAIFKRKLIDKIVLKDIAKEELAEKTELAEKVVSVIKENDVIFLDDSTITILVAALLQKKKMKLTVITNMLGIQKILSENKSIEVISLGGIYDSRTDSFIGEMARQNLERFNPNKVFIGTCGINVDRMQLSACTIDEGKFKSTALKIGQESYILAQNKKFFQDSLYNFSSIVDKMTIITDKNISHEIESKLLHNNVKIMK
ncbi:MAG: DeoR/GlpR family DNA-binding transcription regulator [Cetobacterium sp.]|uniref:DeoR/GlpR family DNA-binding transcription regulator n=1 Tax=Cetobacterium sp. TaxID=2071632 RepID=UPI003F3C6C79